MGYSNATSKDFSRIPGCPIAYWIGDATYNIFKKNTLTDYAKPKSGLSTTDNDRFLRLFWEVSRKRIFFTGKNCEDLKKFGTGIKWVPMTKGGDFNRWYGNNYYVVNFENDGEELKYWITHNPKDPKTNSYSRYIRNYDSYLQEGISFNDVSSGKTSFRWQPYGYIPNARGPFIYSDDYVLLGFLNSAVCKYILDIIAPTLTYNVGDVSKIPYEPIDNEDIKKRVSDNVTYSKEDWDSFETSWDFKKHPLI